MTTKTFEKGVMIVGSFIFIILFVVIVFCCFKEKSEKEKLEADSRHKDKELLEQPRRIYGQFQRVATLKEVEMCDTLDILVMKGFQAQLADSEAYYANKRTQLDKIKQQ